MKIKTMLTIGLAISAIAPSFSQLSNMVNDGAQKRMRTPRNRVVAMVPPTNAYAWMVRDRADIPLGLVNFSLASPQNISSLFALQDKAYAGANTPVGYFFYRFHDDPTTQDMQPLAFSKVDPTTGNITDVADWSGKAFIFNDMAYNRKTGKLYGLAREYYTDDFLTALQFEYSALYEISPTTGIANRVKQFIDWGSGATNNPSYLTLTCDFDGNMYCIDATGYLVSIDIENDYAATTIGDTGRRPAKRLQTMDYDPASGMIYWAADYQSELADLCVIDPLTAETKVVATLGNDARLAGLAINYEMPRESAPGAVTNLVASSSADGDNVAQVSFTLPSQSFGGTNLASISTVTLKRNNEVIQTWQSQQPGAQLSYTDNMDASGVATYSVTASNVMGAGLEKNVTLWVGHDVPDAVTNVGVGRNDDGSAIIVWNAPTDGMHGGWIDIDNLKYDVVRMPGNTLVGENITETRFEDHTVTTMSRYSYEVIAHTPDGRGPSVSSVAIELGNEIASFPYNCLFSDESSFNTWTVINANGGSTWKWKHRGLKDYDGFAMYEYDNNNDADDYLVTPKMSLKAGATYTIKFNYRGSNDRYKENFEVVFGNEATKEGLNTSLKSYTTTDGEGCFDTLILPEITEDGVYYVAFHATSPKGRFNLYITDVTIEEFGGATPPTPPVSGGIEPVKNLKATVAGDGSVVLSWNHGNQTGGDDSGDDDEPGISQISEDWESYPNWELNPTGLFNWTYVDADGGKPYTSDYGEMPYPTDGKPLAAMIMNPYELGSEIYTPNPSHSGEKYLLFKSNFAAGDGTRPAPKPDDYLISPKLDIDSEFVFSFYCKADPDLEAQEAGSFWGDPWNTEQFRVGYSTTGNSPEDFTWMSDEPQSVTNYGSEWTLKEYAIPAGAKYVCINYCTQENGFWFMVDDIYIGKPQFMAPARENEESVEFNHFDVYLGNEKCGETKATSYKIASLSEGDYVASVVAVYNEGESDPTTVTFSIKLNSIDEIEAAGVQIVEGGIISEAAIDVYTLDGKVIATNQSGMIMLTPGIYILRTSNGVLKVLVK